MSSIEILSLVITIVCLVSFCLVFTYLFRNYYLNNIKEIKDGTSDLEIIEYNKENKLNDKKNEKKVKIRRVISKTIGYLSLVLVVGFFGFSLYSRFFNNNLIFGDSGLVVISSGSMSEKNSSNTYLVTNNLNNQFDTYDIIGISKYKSIDDVKLYDVIAFYGEDDVIYVHRIIEINEDKTLVTRGDSNNISDTNRLYEGNLDFSNVIGYYNGSRVPLIGVFIIFLQSNSGIITILSIVYCLLMFDYYKNKYDTSLLERINYLDEIINFDYLEEMEVNKVITPDYKEYLYYKNKEYSFYKGKFIEVKEVSDEYINSVKELNNKIELENKELEENNKYNFINKLKNIFKKKDKEDKKE